MKLYVLTILVFSALSSNVMAKTSEKYEGVGPRDQARCTLEIVKDAKDEIMSIEVGYYGSHYQAMNLNARSQYATVSAPMFSEGIILKEVIADDNGDSSVAKITVKTENNVPSKVTATFTRKFSGSPLSATVTDLACEKLRAVKK